LLKGKCERQNCRSAGKGILLLTDNLTDYRLSSLHDGVLSANFIANILIILYDAPVFNRFFYYLFNFYVVRKNITAKRLLFGYIDI